MDASQVSREGKTKTEMGAAVVSYSYRKMTPDYHEYMYRALQAAEKAQDSLLDRFEALAALVPAQVADHSSVKALMDGVREDIAKQADVKEIIMDYIPREFRRTDAAGPLAQRVFGTPELLERILLLVPTRTCFEANRVCKDFHSTIAGSPKPQRRLGLQADSNAHVSLKANGYFDTSSGIGWKMTGTVYRQTDEGPETDIRITTNGYADHARTPGSPLRRVQLTQPPIQDLDVRTLCCNNITPPPPPYITPPPTTTMYNEAGITSGELYDNLVALRRAHRLCPTPVLAAHDEEGVVHPRVEFSGTLVLRVDDHVVQADKAAEAEAKEANEARQSWEARIRAYMDAKEGAERYRLPIPTLAEFEAEQKKCAQLGRG